MTVKVGNSAFSHGEVRPVMHHLKTMVKAHSVEITEIYSRTFFDKTFVKTTLLLKLLLKS